MVAALCLLTATVLTAADAPSATSQSGRLSLGIDATEVFPSFGKRPPEVDPALLPLAPTSGTVAMAASLATVGTGMVMLTGFVLLMAVSFSLPPLIGIVGASLGFALINFGASVGDLLNGDWQRFVLHGLVRLASLLATPFLGPLALGYWGALIVGDIVSASDAPARWVERTHPGGASAPGPAVAVHF